MSDTDNLEVAECGKVCEAGVVSLNVYVTSHFFQSTEHFEFLNDAWLGIWGTKRKILIYLLEPIEGRVQDGETPLENCAVPERVDIASVNHVSKMTNLRTGTIAGDAFSINSLKYRQ